MKGRCTECGRILDPWYGSGVCPDCGGTILSTDGGSSDSNIGAKIITHPAIVKTFILALIFIGWSYLVKKFLPAATPEIITYTLGNVLPVILFAILYRISAKFWFFKYFTYVLLIAGVVFTIVLISSFTMSMLWKTLMLFAMAGASFWWMGKCDNDREMASGEEKTEE